MATDQTTKILAQHDRFIDSLISSFDEKLQPLIDDAQKRTLKALEKRLTFTSAGVIDKTPANQRVLRSIDRMFKTEMNRSTKAAPGGYKQVVQAFSDQFADHLPKFEKVLNDISATLDARSRFPPVKFTGDDLDLFASQAVGTKELLLDVLDTSASAAKRQALFNAGGLGFSDLTSELAKQFGKTIAQARAIADFSVSSLYRTVADQSYKKIEQGLAKGAVFYEYAGPDDSLTRPFCEMLLHRTAKKPMTRQEIDGLDNGTGLPVWTSGGGWGCRHSILLAGN